MHHRCSGVSVLSECEPRNYFERGIRVCARWNDFWVVLADMGRAECWHREISLDRIDNDGDYAPDNCRWATSTTQVRNSRAVKLNPAKVKEIRRLMLEGASKEDVARTFNVSTTTVLYIVTNRTWRADTQKVINGRLIGLTREELRAASRNYTRRKCDGLNFSCAIHRICVA